MDFTSRKTALLILGITSIVCSRTWFFFLNDPEGPNLLIVMVLAAVVYSVSFAAYTFTASTTPPKRLLVAISAQILFVTSLYFLLR